MNAVVEKDCREVLERINAITPKIAGKTFLIAGASSFLGSSIINVLIYYNTYIAKSNEDKCTIYGLYHNRNKMESRFKEYLSEDYFKTCQWDATDSLDTVCIDSDVDYIFYLCSIASTDLSKSRPVETLQANTIGLGNMLSFAKDKAVKGFLYFSSGAVYGAPQGHESEIFEDDRWPIDHMEIGNIYAEGKRAGETLCKAFFAEYGVKTKMVRISHTYGPGIDIDDGRIFSDFVRDIVNGNNLTIKGDGSPTRPFCYITDAVAAFFMIMIQGENGEAYNLANPKETYSIGELADILTKEAFPERELVPQYLSKKGNIHPEKVHVNIDKLCKLGWEPKVSVVDGFKRVVESIEV